MGRNDNLPPGVSVGMLPGNTSNDAAWEKFEDWALTELSTGDLTVEEAYMAVRAGLATVNALRKDISMMIGEARQDERVSGLMEQGSCHEAANDLFHKLWTANVGEKGYDKEKWKELAALLNF